MVEFLLKTLTLEVLSTQMDLGASCLEIQYQTFDTASSYFGFASYSWGQNSYFVVASIGSLLQSKLPCPLMVHPSIPQHQLFGLSFSQVVD